MLAYAKFIKVLVTKKRTLECEIIKVSHSCSTILTRHVVAKKDDPGVLIIPCTIETCKFGKALCDLGATINLMPLLVFEQLNVEAFSPLSMKLLVANRLVKKPIGIIYGVLVRVDRLIFLADFVVLDYDIDVKVKIIVGRPFLATSRVLVDLEEGDLKFKCMMKK